MPFAIGILRKLYIEITPNRYAKAELAQPDLDVAVKEIPSLKDSLVICEVDAEGNILEVVG